MIRQSANKFLLAAAAVALALGGVQPAFAKGGHGGGHRGGGHHGGGHHGGGHHGGGHHGGHSYYGGHYGYGYGGYSYGHRGHHHGHGGDAALIALGVVGGLILIDSALDKSRGGYYAPSYGYSGGYSGYAAPRPSSEYYYRQSPSAAPAGELEDDADYRSEGGTDYRDDAASERAFIACTNRARQSLRQRGLMTASPAVPNSAQKTSGGAWRFEADFTTQDRRGGQLLRTMTCEADESGVRLLELI